jgi:2-methylaconitate cis-trans-isomerase PrpF
MEFVDPAGSLSRGLLPSGLAQESIAIADGRVFRVSVVDAANPVVFLLASELGLSGIELPDELERYTAATDVLEQVRSVVAERLGIVGDASDATVKSPGLPKVGFVAAPTAYRTSNGREVAEEEMDISARLMSMQAPHRSYMSSGAVCTGAAAVQEGTIVHELARTCGIGEDGKRVLRIAHPSGVMRVSVDVGLNSEETTIRSIGVERTARLLMSGDVYVPRDIVM